MIVAWQSSRAAMIAALQPAAWYRFNQGITVATGVSQWNDASGNGRHLTQATAGFQPAKQADGSILFDGTDDFLVTAAATSFAQPVSIYALMKQITWTAGDYIVDLGTAAGGAVLRQPSGIGATPDVSLLAGTNVISSDLTLGNYGAVRAVLNGASSVIGVSNGNEASGNAGAGAPGGAIALAAANNGVGASNIQVKEFIVFAQAHDAVTRGKVNAYLMSVGGL